MIRQIVEKFNMRKVRVINVICRKKNGVLEYLIIEHSAINPADFLEDLVYKNEFGMLLLANDGPSLLKEKELEPIPKPNVKLLYEPI
jgi:hypothetical protein